jgi:hypothetical protein
METIQYNIVSIEKQLKSTEQRSVSILLEKLVRFEGIVE